MTRNHSLRPLYVVKEETGKREAVVTGNLEEKRMKITTTTNHDDDVGSERKW